MEDPLENVGVKLVRQAGAKTNDLAGDGSTTSIVLARGLIDEGVKVIISLSERVTARTICFIFTIAFNIFLS